MSYRWGLSHNAYQHWSFIFDKELPIEIQTEQSSISVAGYLRDVIKYAHENKLKGADWFKKVTVSPVTKDTVRITMKKRYVKINNYPTHGIFDLMEMHQSKQLAEHYKFVISDDYDEVESLMNTLGVEIRDLGNSIVEITKLSDKQIEFEEREFDDEV